MRISFKIENNIGIIWPWNSPHIEDEILEAAPNNTPWPKPQRQKPPRRSDCLSQPTASLPFRFSPTSGGRRPAMAAPPSPRSPKAQSVGGDAPLSLFLDTDLGTRLALLAAPDTTISRLKCTGPDASSPPPPLDQRTPQLILVLNSVQRRWPRSTSSCSSTSALSTSSPSRCYFVVLIGVYFLRIAVIVISLSGSLCILALDRVELMLISVS
jgi:hypothetical protein